MAKKTSREKKRLLTLFGSVCLILILAVLSFMAACAKPAPSAPVPAEAPAPTLALGSIRSQQEGIWVNGRGEVTVPPDIANLRLGVEAREATVSQAQAEASEAMGKIMSALADSGIPEKDIQTQYFRISQVTRWDPETEEEFVAGYRVRNNVIVKIRDIDTVGAIIDAVVEAGGDLTRIDSMDFSIDDPSAYYQETRELAMADAKAKAEELARLAGLTLGKPTFISEGAYIQPFYQEAFYGGMAPPAPAPAPYPMVVPPPMSPGEITVTLSVQVGYSILP